MSVEINVGDMLHCEDTICHTLRYRPDTESGVALNPRRMSISTATVLFIKYIGSASFTFKTGYLIAKEDDTTFVVNLLDLYMDKTASINSTQLWNQLSPNKWTEFVSNKDREIPYRLTTTKAGTLNSEYERLIKKYVPLRRRLYLWICAKWHTLIG